jgi:uncharacterized membrane protein
MSPESIASTPIHPRPVRILPIGRTPIVLLLAGILIFGWFAAPAGLLGKADAVAYAVCHRIESHSLHLGDRQLPLCARCTGTFLGAIIGAGALFATGRGRRAVWPPMRVAVVLAATIVPWGFDGLNSYLTLLPGLPHLYQPENWLRLTTGIFLGLSMTVLFLPAVNQSLWKDTSMKPMLGSFKELLLFFMLAPILIALVLLDNSIILYPLAILSSLGVLFLLTGVFTAAILMLFKKEGLAETWRDALPVIAVGLVCALLMIGGIDFIRYHFTGTWSGFQIGG